MMHSFTWDQEVALCLIQFLQDPELVRYFLAILRPRRRDLLEDEAREFHDSLRMTKEGRWKEVAELSQKRKFYAMNASVPISCTLPFDGGMWRNSCMLLRSVKYFQHNFIREMVPIPEFEEHSMLHVNQNLSDKINTVNLMLEEGVCGEIFRNSWSKKDIEEALSDFEIVDNWSDDEEPYILSGQIYIDIIN